MPASRSAHRALLASLRQRQVVICESPLRPKDGRTEEDHKAYARAAIADSLARGEAPFASHLFYTQFLDDNHDASRRTGMMCGWAWLARASLVAVYLDLGWSHGMREGVALARSLKIRVEERAVPGWVAPAKPQSAAVKDYMRQLVEDEPDDDQRAAAAFASVAASERD